jgi:hypothetical protein
MRPFRREARRFSHIAGSHDALDMRDCCQRLLAMPAADPARVRVVDAADFCAPIANNRGPGARAEFQSEQRYPCL